MHHAGPRPNRTQEILYGPTLRPFLLSDLIGKTLFERLAVKPQAIIVKRSGLPVAPPAPFDSGGVRQRGRNVPDATEARPAVGPAPQRARRSRRRGPQGRDEGDCRRVRPAPKQIARVRDALEETLRVVTAA